MIEVMLFAGGFGAGGLLAGILLLLIWLSSAAAVNRGSLAPVALGLVCRLAVLACVGLLTVQLQPPGVFVIGVCFGLLVTRWVSIQSARFAGV